MHWRTLLLHFVIIATIPMSNAADFRLGIASTVKAPDGALPYGAYIRSLQVDANGFRYVLATADPAKLAPTMVLAVLPGAPSVPYVLKLSPAADRIVYLTVLDFGATSMAVDSAGNVFLSGPAPGTQLGTIRGEVVKLKADGTGVSYRFFLGDNAIPEVIAVDSTGRAYIAGQGILETTANVFQKRPANGLFGGFVLRLNAAGSAIDWATYLSGTGNVSEHMEGISVDDTGAVSVAGVTESRDFPTTPGAWRSDENDRNPFLTKLAPDGSSLVYSTIAGDRTNDVVRLAVDASGSATVLLSNPWILRRFDVTGKSVVYSRSLPFLTTADMVVSRTGEIYLTGHTTRANMPVRNSLATCAASVSNFLAVFNARGDVLQATYLPANTGDVAFGGGVIALGSNDDVQLFSTEAANQVLFTASVALRQDPAARVVQLACMGNAATFDPPLVAPGEIVSLFGNGLAPGEAVSIAPGADRYPTDARVKVLFDDVPAPLLYVSDTQINAIAPWSLTIGKTTQICVVYAGRTTNCLERRVASTVPGVFTDTCGYAAALNQDSTINSADNPAEPGNIVSVFATGLGPINPAVPDGAIIRPPLPVNVFTTEAFRSMGTLQFATIPAAVTYYGPAPFQVAGFSQVNLQVSFEPMAIRVWNPDAPVNSDFFRVHVKGSPLIDTCVP